MRLLRKLLFLLVIGVGVPAAVMLLGRDSAPAIAGSAAVSQARPLHPLLRKDNVNGLDLFSEPGDLPEATAQSQFNSHYADLGSSAHAAMIDQNDLRIAAIHLSYR